MAEALSIDHVSKRYRLGLVGSGTLRDDLAALWYRMRGKPDPTLTIGEENDRTKTGTSDYVWALRDVSFTVNQGEVVGIIGRNGAGKSTLLKLLSRVTAPTSGQIKVRGRIASLLEVGTGFHPELTGRENIYLNGAIMGMRRHEITSKLDAIVEFAGVQRYLDTPVKRYSSGMYVRLAFAVAAHLEPEILVVDEVLAVGDAEFLRKSLGKMQEVTEQGRTIIFVSHNLPAMKQLCPRSVYLVNGQVRNIGPTTDIIREYKSSSVPTTEVDLSKYRNDNITLLEVTVSNASGGPEVSIEDEVLIRTVFDCHAPNRSFALSYNVFTDEGILLFEAFAPFANQGDSRVQRYTVEIVVPAFTFNSGQYHAKLIFGEAQKYIVLSTDTVLHFEVDDTLSGVGTSLNRIPGLIRPKLSYAVK